MKEDKKILIFLRSFQIGGAERQAALLANHLSKLKGLTVEVWAYSPPGPLLGKLNSKIRTKNIPFKLDNELPKNRFNKFIDLFKLALNIRKFHPDLIMAYTHVPNRDCGAIWRFTGAKSFIWNQRDEGLEFSNRWLEKFSLFNTPVFVANSIVAQNLLRAKTRNKRVVKYIPNGVYLEPAKNSISEWRKRLGALPGQIIAVMIGNLSNNKDHVNLFYSWKMVLGKIKEKKKPLLVLAGRFDGTEDKLINLAKKLRIEDNIKFLGFVEDVPGLLAACDIGVFSSKSEGSPNGLLECMAIGLPVVSNDIPGVKEALGDDYPYLSAIGDHKAFSDHVLTLIKDNVLRKKVGAENKSRINKYFRPDISAAKYLDLFNGLLKQV